MMRFQVLGPLTVERDGSPVPLNAQMLRRLLAAMLVRANHTVTIDQLIASLWGEAAPAGARKTVQIYVHRLRETLGDETRIVQDSGGYRINVAQDELDSERFSSLVSEARTLLKDGERTRAVDLFGQALALWRGPAYEDLSEQPPIHDEARRLDEERLHAVAQHIEIRLSLGHHEDLIPELAGLTERHPYREDLRAHLMLALYRSGRQAEALDVYHRTRHLLDDELGLEPGPALKRMHESILRSAPELELAQPDPAQPAAVPRELPSNVAGFTGRATHLDAMDRVLLRDQPASVPIALITGSGGVGKTALAVHWAHRMLDRFPDGQLFVDLRGYSTGTRMRPIEALTGLLRSLGVPPRRIPIDVAEAAALYRSQLADRRVLVVLDNARSAEEVRTLLPGTPTCAVIVTSRDRLTGLVARDGATRVPLDILSPDEAHALITNSLQGTAAERDAVSALAQTCGHLPLALRIALAQLSERPHQTVGTLVARLRAGHRLHALQVIGDESAAVRNTLALSYRAVPPEAQLLFRRLGVVPLHDFTAESAAALAGATEDEAEILLERLADAHLVTAIPPERYTIHDLLRELADERCAEEDSPADRKAVAVRLLDRYLARVDAAAQLLYPGVLRLPVESAQPTVRFQDMESALSWLDSEHGNIVAAIRHGVTIGIRESAWLLADQMRGYFDLRRHLAPWFDASRAGLWAARAAQNVANQGAMFLMLGHAYGAAGSYDLARANFARALDRFSHSEFTEGEAAVLANIGVLDAMAGRSHIAKQMFLRAIGIRRKLHQDALNRKTIQNLATCHWQMGELEQAAQICEQAIKSYRSTGEPSHRLLVTVGKINCLRGQYVTGLRYLTEVLMDLRATGNLPFIAYAHIYISEALLDLGRDREAWEPASEGVRVARAIGLSYALTDGLVALGKCLQRLGDHDGAHLVLKEAVETAARAHTSFELVGAQIALACHHLTRDDHISSLRVASEAADACLERHYRLRQGQASVVMAQAYCGLGDHAKAVTLATDTLEIQRETGHLLGQAEAHDVLALAHPDPATARQHAEAAHRIYQQTGAVPPRGVPVSSR